MSSIPIVQKKVQSSTERLGIVVNRENDNIIQQDFFEWKFFGSPLSPRSKPEELEKRAPIH